MLVQTCTIKTDITLEIFTPDLTSFLRGLLIRVISDGPNLRPHINDPVLDYGVKRNLWHRTRIRSFEIKLSIWDWGSRDDEHEEYLVLSAVMWRGVVWQTYTEVSKEHTVSIFKVKM